MAAASPSWRQWFPAGKTLVHPVPVGGLAPAQSKRVKVSSVLFTSDGKMSREMRQFGAASVGLQGPWTKCVSSVGRLGSASEGAIDILRELSVEPLRWAVRHLI